MYPLVLSASGDITTGSNATQDGSHNSGVGIMCESGAGGHANKNRDWARDNWNSSQFSCLYGVWRMHDSMFVLLVW